MANWKKTIKLKHLLSDRRDAEAIKALANGALEALKDEPTAPIEHFKNALEMADMKPEVALLLVNGAMENLYDWADDNSVWIG